MLYLLIDDTGRVLGAAEDDPQWQDGDGREVIAREDWSFVEYAAVDSEAATLGSGGELAYDRATRRLIARARPLTPVEQDATVERTLRDQLQAAYDGWAKLTQAQKDEAIRAVLRAAIRALS
jgi:hypothetical protein